MSAQHTPGPWVVKSKIWLGGSSHVEGPGIFSIEDVATETVICDRRTPWPEQAKTMEANARLIAAAPDLLSELINMTARFKAAVMQAGTDEEFAEHAVASARAAIAKAQSPASGAAE